MSYFAPYVDGSGLHFPTYQDILDDMRDKMRTIYGDDIYLENDSADYQLLSIFALKTYDTLQAIQYAYNSRSPVTAVGTALDLLVKLNGISRKAAGYSTCEVLLTGEPFTQITAGVIRDTAGLLWDLPRTCVIGADGLLSTTATCETAGTITAAVGAVCYINTPTYGWTSVTNTSAAVTGNDEETDAELRARQTRSVANPSQTMLAGTRAALLALDNVARVAVYENDTNLADVTDDNPHGLPAHSVTCVVEGGADDEIAEAIMLHKGIGCYTNGPTEIKYTDEAGYKNTVRFYRPTYKTIFVSVTIVRYSGYIASINGTVKTEVYTYLSGLDIGADVSVSVLTGIITACNPDTLHPIFGVGAITIGTDENALAATDIDLAFNEVAAPDYGAITVMVES